MMINVRYFIPAPSFTITREWSLCAVWCSLNLKRTRHNNAAESVERKGTLLRLVLQEIPKAATFATIFREGSDVIGLLNLLLPYPERLR